LKITIAKTAGFCMGVRRAVEMALDAPDQHQGPIYTYGPLIHNPQVLQLLQAKGITVIDELPPVGSGTVLIRAHGVPPDAREGLIRAGFKVIDATCPRVIKVQTIIRQHARKGYASIIIGDRDHPEVTGLLGYAGAAGHAVDNLADLDRLPVFDRAIIVAQTTQNTRFFGRVRQWAADHHPHYKIFDTICDSTEKRQAEVKQLAADVDAVVVVGGRSSGNTQRLVQIAAESGKPSFHIETEDDLDDKALEKAECIGVTAGASTPNWIIRGVYRRLEQMPLKKRSGWKGLFVNLQRFLLLTNLYVSLGAGCLSYSGAKLMRLPCRLSYVLISVLYVLSMHILNNLTGRNADHYNEPERAFFYEKYKAFLTFLALFAGGAGLMTAFAMGFMPFMVLLVMSLMGLSYNLQLLPDRWPNVKYHRIRELPGSKTLLIAMAWGVVTSVFPSLALRGTLDLTSLLVFVWATGIVFVRTALFDILDMQGDRIVGKGTIPIIIGEKQTLKLLKVVLAALVVLLAAAGFWGLFSTLAYALAICPVFIYFILAAHERGHMLPGLRLEFLVETQFMLAGLMAFIWSAGSSG